MRLHRFHVEETIGNKKDVVLASAEVVSQIRHVFRLKNGEHVVLFDGSGSDYECEIVGGDKKVLNMRIVSSGRSTYMPTRKIYLCAAIVKKDNFEFIAEKATELGVTDIVPIIAERTEKKALNSARLKKIVIEASEQCGRGDVPMIWPVIELHDLLADFNDSSNPEDGDVISEKHFSSLKRSEKTSIAFHTTGQKFEHDDISEDSPIVIFIGPEGGWSPDEIDLFHRDEVLVRCLGDQVLRSETAVISALSQVVF